MKVNESLPRYWATIEGEFVELQNFSPKGDYPFMRIYYKTGKEKSVGDGFVDVLRELSINRKTFEYFTEEWVNENCPEYLI